MSAPECHFELRELRCAGLDEPCGRQTGKMGTCEDFDYCDQCRKWLMDAGISQFEITQAVLSTIPGYRLKGKRRAKR